MNLTQSTNCKVPEPTAVEDGMRVFIAICLSIIITVSLLGNLLVCIAFKVNENLRIVSNYFIVSLAISDIMTAIFVVPFDLNIIIKRGSWVHGDTMCQFYTTMYLISAPASVLNLLGVSIDRFRLINNPFAYQRTTTPMRVLAVIACVWMYATLMALLPVMGWKDPLPPSNKTNCTSAPQCVFPIAYNYSVMISVLHFVIPPLIMAIIYFKIYTIARSHIRRIHRLESITGVVNGKNSLTCTTSLTGSRPSSRNCSPSKEGVDANCNGHDGHATERKVMYTRTAPPSLRKNVKAAKSLAIIVGAFFICWYPLTLASVAVNLCGGMKGSCYVQLKDVWDFLLTIGYLNGMLNPFLYAFHNKEFKRTYKRILHWRWR